MKTLDVALGERSYPIHIGCGLLPQAGTLLAQHFKAPRAIIISDERVAQYHLQTLQQALDSASIRHDAIIVPAGEGSKSFAQYEALMNELLSLTPDRNTMLIALGGGVVGDLCGFAASSLLRGVDFIQIPTSLLAQVDSSVGGKTGINAKAGKNLIGAFYQPKAVLIDVDVLQTLPERELKAGYAEVYKYGLIGDAAFAEWLHQHGGAVLKRDEKSLIHAIHTSCAAKAAVVAADEKEGGKRALLNLGHTFGHALEAETGMSDVLLHGEAVAIGMVMACQLSETLCDLPAEVTQQVMQHLKESGLPVMPTDVQANWDVDALCQHFFSDKKTEDGALTFIVLNALGDGVVQKGVTLSQVRPVVATSVLG